MVDRAWILLQSSRRVNLWRKLKKIGAVSQKTSAYLLPDTPSHHEHFQWLAQQVRDAGGDATLICVTELERMTGAVLARFFNGAQEYTKLLRPLNALFNGNKKRLADGFSGELKKLQW